MSAEVATAIMLIIVPVAFNAAFFELGRAFDYPDILRREPDESSIDSPRVGRG